MPTLVSWVTNWLKSPPRLLTCEPDHPILKLDQREFGGELRRVAAALHVRLVNVDDGGPQVGHRAVLSVEQVRCSSVSRAAPGSSSSGPAQQLPVLEKLDPWKAIPLRCPLTPAPRMLFWPIVSLEAPHRQTPRLALELRPRETVKKALTTRSGSRTIKVIQ